MAAKVKGRPKSWLKLFGKIYSKFDNVDFLGESMDFSCVTKLQTLLLKTVFLPLKYRTL